MTFIDVEPAPVASAATATWATGSTWRGWARRSTTTLDDVAGGARDPRVTAAFAAYAEQVRPVLESTADLAEHQGGALGSAVTTLVGADQDAQAELQVPLDTGTADGTSLSRPITV